MDKMLKQRLIGATILIALAVIFVPMLFEEPSSLDGGQEFSMDVPPPPSGRGEIRRLPLDPARMSEPRVVEPAVPSPEPDYSDPPGFEPPGEVPPDDGPISEPEEDLAQAPDLDRSTDPLEPSPEPTTEMSADESPEAVREPEPAAPIATPLAQDAPTASGDWIVQVASFSSAETAERIKDQLQQLGHSAGSDLLVRGDTRLHRVWTGPYVERVAAERARSQIAATIGDVDPLVKNMTGNEGAIPAGGTAEPAFSVQVGSFAEKANAERQTGQLLEQGFDAFIHADASGSRPIWRVRVGQFGGREQAAALLERLRSDEGLEGLIVTHP